MRTLLGIFLLSLVLFMGAAKAHVYDYTLGNRLSLLEDPKASAQLKIELIKKAKHHIHITTFFWDRTPFPKEVARELEKASARGVEVRILSSFLPTLVKDTFYRGRSLLKKSSDKTFIYLALSPGRLFSVNHNLHEKIFLVDGEKAIIGGRNISDSSFAGKDMEVLMEGPVVNQVQDHFKKMFDFMIKLEKNIECLREDSFSCEEKLDQTKFNETFYYFPKHVGFADGVEARILSHEAVIHQYDGNLNRKERLLQQDDILDTVTQFEFKTLRAYNYFIFPTKRYSDFLKKSLSRGSKIEMITNSLETGKFSSNRGYIYGLPESLEMVKDGVELYQWQKTPGRQLTYVHEKVMIFDEDRVVIGSHNFGTGSTSVSNEISIEIKSRAMAQRLIEIFDEEKTNLEITKPVDASFLQGEMNQLKKTIFLLRLEPVGGFLRELY